MFARRTNWNLSANRFALALESTRRCGDTLLDLTASNPTTVGLRFENERILRALQHPNALAYEPASKGILPARDAVAAYYAGRDIKLSPEQIILTVSTSEAYSYCFRLLCDPGDQVLVPSPSYPLFEFLADIQDVELVPYELVYDHGWQIEFESLRRAITPRSRAIMVVHPNNPTGHFTRSWELERLNALCRENDLALIADEVFLDYGITGETPLSFAANDGALTFTLSGLSKICALPQVKVAWVAANGPREIVRTAVERLDVIADTYLSPNAPIQWAIPELLKTREEIQCQLRERVLCNLHELDAQLANARMTTRLSLDAGWYAVLRTPATRSDEDVAIALLEQERLIIHPGHFFDFPGAGYLVASLIAPEKDFREGIGRVLRAMDAHV
ncbi:MAG TPA: pyridoxal phosphate-dependent aminotransferase [Candidatus Saccharimonadales bacterium]|nr:pyridoxal phosphate-dependent aminotransferase [Candidatus Saccharimonadales bacterium]